MSLGMLEQIAQRFELYASDQEAMFKRPNSQIEKRRMLVRAEIWRDAAKELRTIGAINRDEFLAEIAQLVHQLKDPDGIASPTDDALTKTINGALGLFITPPIPAPTPRDKARLAYAPETVQGVPPTPGFKVTVLDSETKLTEHARDAFRYTPHNLCTKPNMHPLACGCPSAAEQAEREQYLQGEWLVGNNDLDGDGD